MLYRPVYCFKYFDKVEYSAGGYHHLVILECITMGEAFSFWLLCAENIQLVWASWLFVENPRIIRPGVLYWVLDLVSKAGVESR